MIVARPPDQMRPQRNSCQRITARRHRTVGRKNRSFGHRLGLRVMREISRWVRSRFVDSRLIASIEHDARGTGVNELRNTLRQTRRDHVLGPDHVRAMIVVVPPPHARLRRNMEHRLAAPCRRNDHRAIGDVSGDTLHTQRLQRGIVPARQAAHRVPARDELPHDRLSQKSSATRHQNSHRFNVLTARKSESVPATRRRQSPPTTANAVCSRSRP